MSIAIAGTGSDWYWLPMDTHTALLRAIETVGSQAKLAATIGRTQPDISKWLHRDKQGVPAEVCIAIERATRGRVTRYELRPDVFGEAPVKRRRKVAT